MIYKEDYSNYNKKKSSMIDSEIYIYLNQWIQISISILLTVYIFWYEKSLIINALITWYTINLLIKISQNLN
jgi:hypothetical protein